MSKTANKSGGFGADDFPVLARPPKRPGIAGPEGEGGVALAPAPAASGRVFPSRAEPVKVPLENEVLVSEDGTVLMWANVDHLEVWPHNPRHVIDPIRLDELATNIAEHKQKHPADVIKKPGEDGVFQILAGQRRWLAIKSRNLQGGRILIRVHHNLSHEDMYAMAIDTQANTEDLSDLDYAISLAKTKDEIGVRALSRNIKKSAGEISKLRQIGEMNSRVLEVLKRSVTKFSYPFAYQVAQVFNALGEDTAIEFAQEILTKDLTFRSATNRREDLMGMRVRQTRSSWNTLRLLKDGKPMGSFKTRESTGEVSLSMKGLPDEALKEIQAVVEKAMRMANGQGR